MKSLIYLVLQKKINKKEKRMKKGLDKNRICTIIDIIIADTIIHEGTPVIAILFSIVIPSIIFYSPL